MIKVDLHTHTVATGHAFNTVSEMAARAKEIGIEILGFAEHGPILPDGASVSYFNVGKRLPNYIDGVRILFGAELNIISAEGELDLEEKVIKDLDYVIAGMHIYKDNEGKGKEYYTKAIVNAIKNPLVQMISHPYLVGRNGLDIDIDIITETACEYDKLLEVNSSFFYKSGVDKRVPELIKRMVEILKSHNKKTIINSDAHMIYELGKDKEVREKFNYLGLTEDDIINNDIEAVKAYFGL